MHSNQLTLAAIVLLTLAVIPTIACAVDVTVTVNGGTPVSVTAVCTNPPPGLDTSSGNACIDLTGTYGSVNIASGQVVALRQSNNQIVLQGADITNNDPSNPATVAIRYGHLFIGTEGSPIDTSRLRFYGVSLSGIFFTPQFTVASNDNVDMTALVRYSFFEGGTTRLITGESSVHYTVPANVVDISLNSSPPARTSARLHSSSTPRLRMRRV